MSSELVMYFSATPNFESEGCMVTHAHSDGVVINNIQTVTGELCFVGRQVIEEAFCEIVDTTPAKLRKLLAATDKVAKLEKQIEALNKKLAGWEAIGQTLEDAGMVIKELV